MELDAALARIDQLTGVIVMLVGLVLAILLAWWGQPLCDPRCGHCKDERAKSQAKAIRAWWGSPPPEIQCPLHRVPFSKCPPGSHDE